MGLLATAADPRAVADGLHSDVADLKTGVTNAASRLAEEIQARSAGPGRIGHAKVAPNVTEAGGAQQSIDHGVGDCVTVGMALESIDFIGPFETGQPQGPSGNEAVDIGADAYAGTRRCHGLIMPYEEKAAAFVVVRENYAVTNRHSAALTGVLAAVAGLSITELLAGILKLRASPVVAIGETVIALTPGGIAHTIIGIVGHADKPLAIASVVVVILGLGATLGRFWATQRIAALGVIVAFVLLGMLAVSSRPNTGSLTPLLCLAGGLVTMAVLHRLNREHFSQDASHNADESRRVFLRNAGLVAAGTAVALGLGRWVGHSRTVVEQARAKLKLPTRNVATPTGVELKVANTPPWRTPPKDFYRIDTALTVPLIQPDEWRLRIHGMVDKEMTLTYQDLLDRGLSDAWITISCVSNEVGGDLIGNTIWSGVPIRGILDEVGVKPGADALLSKSQDGWTAGTPLGSLTDGRNAMLAVAMDGEPLPIEHGFPVRQVVPGLYGYVSATKWVTDWEITRFQDFTAYWTDRGWSPMGPIKTESRIDTPGGKAKAGVVKVAGTAWAQQRGVEAVEVRVDGGVWNKATLAKVPNVDTWVQWVWDWQAVAGDHRLEVRATDSTGTPQTAKRADVLPDGATGYDAAFVTVS